MTAGLRVVVVCGVETSTGAFADATVRALRDAGRRVRLVVADDTEPTPGSRAPWYELLGAGVRSLGGSALPTAAVLGLASARHAAVLSAVAAGLDEGDVVVLDAGDQRAGRDLLAHAPAVRSAIEAVLGPPLATASDDGADGGFARLTAARDAAEQAADLLTGRSTAWRLVVPPRPGAAARATRALGALATLGAPVDGVVLDDYPRKDSGAADRADAAAARDLLRAATRARVWRARDGLPAAPKGRAVDVRGPVEEVLRTQDPIGDDATWEWSIGLPGPAVGSARVGVDEDHVVVEVDGAYRWLPLPPVLRRTTAVDARRVEAGLVIRFRTDADRWRAS